MVDSDTNSTRVWAMSEPTINPPLRLGLQANLAQFSLLVGVNALVGGMIGQERTVLPLLAKEEFEQSDIPPPLDVQRFLDRLMESSR